MPRIAAVPQWIFRAFALCLAVNTHALMLTKDTVRESTWRNPGSDYATWNDSLSLINTTDDTLGMEAMHLIVPRGKFAHLRLGYKDPYRSSGIVDGPVVHSDQPYRFALVSVKRILPRERIRITGFEMETCIECPTGGGGFNPDTPQDTIAAYLVFETKVSRDTLVVIGTISATSSGILFRSPPPAQPPANGGRKDVGQQRFFNGLGQIGSEEQSSKRKPLKMKFRRKGEDRP